MRPWRQIHIQTLQLHHRDVERLARFEDEWRVKTELIQLDQRLIAFISRGSQPRGSRNRNPCNLCRRPDPQPLPLGPHSPMPIEAVPHRHMKAVQFHPGMESVLQFLHNPRAQIWLGTASKNCRNRQQPRQNDAESPADPNDPPVPAPE